MSLLKGFDWEEASLLILTASLLAIFRRSFYRPSRLTELPFSPLYLVASVCVLAASIWLLLFAYQDVPYSHQLCGSSPWTPMPRRAALAARCRSAAGGGVADLAAAHGPPGH